MQDRLVPVFRRSDTDDAGEHSIPTSLARAISIVLLSQRPLNEGAAEHVSLAGGEALGLLVGTLPPLRREVLDLRLKRHLRCGIFAGSSRLLESISDIDVLFESAVSTSMISARRGFVLDVSRELMNDWVSLLIDRSGGEWQPTVGEVLLLLRVCAVLNCPNVMRHPKVYQGCLVPLAGRQAQQWASARP